MKPEKKFVEDTIQYLYWDRISIEKIREDLLAVEKRGANHLTFLITGDYDGSSTIEIEAINRRLETDDEYEERLDRLKSHSEQQRIKELEMLQKLKEKYESDSATK